MTKPTRTPLIGAHRGATATAPENTMAAFQAAIAQHADFIETDIRRTADGVVAGGAMPPAG